MNDRVRVKKFALAICGALLAVWALGGAARAEDALRLRVVSYNIQIGRGPGGSYSDPAQAHLDQTAKRIASFDPCVAGLQEVDNKTNRSGSDVDQLGVLAELTKMNGTFSSKIELPGGEYGVGVLSKEKPISVKKVLMEGSSHTRVLQMVEFEKFVFFNTHYPLKGEFREKASAIVNEQAKNYKKPIILVGDLNAEPDSPEILALKKEWVQVSPEGVPTFSADDPKVQIDFIFVRNASAITVHDAKVFDDPTTSDHRPVFCDITIE